MNEHMLLDGRVSADSLYSFGGNSLTVGQIASQISTHAIAGGVITDLQGGKFGHGFFSAGFTKGAMAGAGFNYGNRSWSAISGRTVIASVVGGTVSQVTGGKFANGARTAALAHLLNAEGGASELFEQAKTYVTGLANGASTVFIGSARAGRQVARSTGVLGMDELRATMKNSEELDKALMVLAEYPDESAQVIKALIEYKVSNASAYDTGTMVGRAATGYFLAPLGVLAGIGDVLTGVENHGATMSVIADYLLYGGPSSNE